MNNIAILGDLFRGKEVIQILESLGGKNKAWLNGKSNTYYCINNNDNKIECHNYEYVNEYCKKYTLEEFEKEFPFKIGDKVITIDGTIGIIDRFEPEKDYPYYIKADVGGFYWCTTSILKPYKEMKEERNITLTLDKAQEWYKKGGELKEIALQAYSEEELNSLPKSWDEYRKRYEFCCFSTRYTNIPLKYDALIKLEQLRNCWRQGWVQTPTNAGYRINKLLTGDYTVMSVGSCKYFLAFPTKEMAEEFLKCFRDLIEKAGDLI